MRIIAGKWRGTALTAVGKGDAGMHLRPTTDRVRESLFNVLVGGKFGNPITGAHVLDLFAGTGALGLEALSRGAKSATLVDEGRVAGRLIGDNIKRLGAKSDASLVKCDATRLRDNPGVACDLVFLDPPYGKTLGARALQSAQVKGWLAPDALIVWEEAAPQLAPLGFQQLDARRYGDTHVTFLRLVSPP
ncbi:16S rRNA (guanine(966)-N(2))-methyltransferase RsmD [Shimia marina]|uniref:Ribosomal RNA small subunit methyltransferase D n=1 Tax=Shimia marina TaxID=321267 RepID=A0A0N7LRJ7_9RHOB|nr:16S rRNA (guanine(966)-N(2))-methyltransferase RsmD [Shimia marina]CUH51012.1 Ribosomal RNA small subunit methyltransferase D [Shimia marina]SFD60380.1 16S rRNA (guanine966-N2)-methyltransferase [Shimia marina]